MIESIPLIDLISYDEMFHILYDKFKTTHQELRYWIKKSLDDLKSANINNVIQEVLVIDPFVHNSSFLLIPYASDLPIMGLYEYPAEGFFYPQCYFYDRQSVLKFIPYTALRFIYQKDLTGKRNWNDYKTNDSSSLICQTLLKANEYGILRFYNDSIDEFTSRANEIQIWCHTFEGEAYVSNPESFFLLYEILTLERIFFKKDRMSCLTELELTTDELPPNVYKFNKK